MPAHRPTHHSQLRTHSSLPTTLYLLILYPCLSLSVSVCLSPSPSLSSLSGDGSSATDLRRKSSGGPRPRPTASSLLCPHPPLLLQAAMADLVATTMDLAAIANPPDLAVVGPGRPLLPPPPPPPSLSSLLSRVKVLMSTPFFSNPGVV